MMQEIITLTAGITSWPQAFVAAVITIAIVYLLVAIVRAITGA